MPVQTQRSQLMAKLGARLAKAHEQHKNDETTYDTGGDLPAGITGGVAQLVDCRIAQVKEGKQHEGEYQFYAAGIVKRPISVNGITVEGLRTSIIEPLYDTPTRKRKTVEDHYGEILMILRRLGVDTKTISHTNIEAVCTALKQAKPHFRFRTWKGEMQTTGDYANKEPRVNHVWGQLTDYNEDATDAVDDGTDELPPPMTEPSANGEAAHEPEQDFNEFEESPGDEEPAPDVDYDAMALDTLIETANGGDTGAQKAINQRALDAGIEQDAIDAATNWVDVGALITDATAPAEPEPPKKGDCCFYKPNDTKTGKPVKKAVECEIMAVDAKTRTVILKNLTNPKVTYKGAKWDALLESA